ncbi:efflux RND transporter periplasmic adaptor subunit [Thiorhodococcus mannitoliphagus]|uniref:Efflux RND transporter periplasmic adaptor subunit n=1 Tax=Thiorhodococcus mannitoliphagus TaxID=329406 RepID=A0A6P1DPM4_9GAMM|nr:efflux RND transporter periplasmic adaptor subunit [Thiorhodococcus mannitoliphagus]NEX19520.1 efflux RND transporter periplasmic adaptor subunit [Thiorhodococcus mannitoliphagus]
MPHRLLIASAIVAAGGASLFGLVAAQEPASPAPEGAPAPVAEMIPPPANESPRWAVVERHNLGGNTTVGGTVVPLEEITFTAQMSGNVEMIAGNEGDFFKRGTTLAELDEAGLRAQRQAALAAIANAQATVRNAEVQYQREREEPSPKQGGNMMSQMMPMPFFGGDRETGVTRGATLHQYRTQIEQAQGAVVTAQAQLREVDAKLEDVKSVAPFDGYITHKHVNPGDTVQPGQPLLSFADMNHLQLQTDVPTRLSAPLTPGFVTKVKLDDPNQTVVMARVAQVFPMADPTRHTVRVKLDLQEGAPAKAGMYAEVLIPQPESDMGSAPAIPISALVYRGGLPMVYVLDAQNRPRLHLLRLGEQYGDRVSVLTGLQGGERVLLNPAEAD